MEGTRISFCLWPIPPRRSQKKIMIILEQIRDKKKMFLLNKSDLSAGFGESDAPDTQFADLKINEEDENTGETVAGEIRAYAGEEEPVIANIRKVSSGDGYLYYGVKKNDVSW